MSRDVRRRATTCVPNSTCRSSSGSQAKPSHIRVPPRSSRPSGGPPKCGSRASRRLAFSNVTEESIGETARVREGEEVAAGKLVDADPQPFLRDATLELDRKEPVVASGDSVDRDDRPPFESAGLAEDDVGFGPHPPFSLLHDLWWNVV